MLVFFLRIAVGRAGRPEIPPALRSPDATPPLLGPHKSAVRVWTFAFPLGTFFGQLVYINLCFDFFFPCQS